MGDVLRLGGFLVAPAEIESTLLEVPGLADAQVVAVPGPSGARAVGFVIVKPGAVFDETAAIAHCRARIAKYKVPARVIALDAYPTTPSANGTKIQRAKLRAMAEAELTQR
jgi:fatty-acyl-CoA synthase